MAFILADRVRETSSAPGTGTVTLLGAVTGYQTFSASIGANNTTYYVIADQSGTNWEVGLGTIGSGGTTLARTTVLSSSNSGSLVNFSSGTQDVFCDYPAEKAIITNDVGDVLVNQSYDQGTGVLQVTGQSTFNGVVTDKSLNLQGGNNLVTYSQLFSNAAWTKTKASLTASATTAPDGTTTGQKLVEDTNSGAHYVSQTTTIFSSTAYTISVYAKAAERTQIEIQFYDGTTNKYPIFSLIDGTKVTDNGIGTAWTSTNVGNGWWKFTITATSATTSTQCAFYPCVSGNVSYTGDGTSGLYIWGAQLELGTVASAYTPTTTAAITTTNNISVPSGQVIVQDGTGALPSYAFSTNPTIGLFKTGAAIGVSIGNTISPAFFGSYMGMPSSYYLGWTSGSYGNGTVDTILARDAANTLAQRNSTNAQTFRLYNTYTDSSNYERLSIDWSTTANTATISTQNAGTGSARNLAIGQDLYVNSVRVGLGGGSVSSNTAVGNSAMAATATAVSTVAIGGNALKSLTSGNSNTGVGYGVLNFTTIGTSNTASGAVALYNNISGSSSVASGYYSLANNTTANALTAIGAQALTNNTTNVATLGTITGGSSYTNGTYTGVVMTLSSGSSAITYPTATIVVSGGVVTTVTLTSNGVGFKDTTTVLTAPAASIGGTGSGFTVPVATLASGTSNVAVGFQAGYSNSVGGGNTFNGYQAGYANTTGTSGTFVGYLAGFSNTTATLNSFFGSGSGATTTTGTSNTGLGYNSLNLNNTGGGNVAVGANSLRNSLGSNNTSLGYQAGYAGSANANTTGANNTYIGFNTVGSAATNTNEMVIGYSAVGLGTNTTVIGNSSTTLTQTYGTYVSTTAQNSTATDIFTSPFIKLLPTATTNTTGFTGIAYSSTASNTPYGFTSGLLRGVSASDVTFIWNAHTNSVTGTKVMSLDISGNLVLASTVKTTPFTVAALPSASFSGVGARAFVTDALAPSFGVAVTGGGAVPVPVYSTGSAWNVG